MFSKALPAVRRSVPSCRSQAPWRLYTTIRQGLHYRALAAHRQRLDIRATENHRYVIYYQHELIAFHARASRPGEHRSVDDHLPPEPSGLEDARSPVVPEAGQGHRAELY